MKRKQKKIFKKRISVPDHKELYKNRTETDYIKSIRTYRQDIENRIFLRKSWKVFSVLFA